MNLVESLITRGWLKTPRLIEAFQKIKRIDFLTAEALAKAGLPNEFKDLAELDEALPIGQNQTISQPLVVAFMLELLQPEAGNKILDVGSGSGWTTALLSEIVGSQGKVIGIEIIPELMKFGQKNAAKYGFVEKGIARFICADGSLGLNDEAPFDRILVSAALDVAVSLPAAWKKQLKIGGRLVAPIGNSIWLFVKKTEEDFEGKEYPGFVFVPLVEKR